MKIVKGVITENTTQTKVLRQEQSNKGPSLRKVKTSNRGFNRKRKSTVQNLNLVMQGTLKSDLTISIKPLSRPTKLVH